MERDREINGQTLLDRYGDEIVRAYRRAVRDVLLKHKRAGNAVVVERDRKMVILQPDEIMIEDE